MIRKRSKERIKEYFLQNPTIKLRVRQIERETKTALPSVTRYVKELEVETILKRQDISGVIFFSADRSSQKFILEKKLFNIKQIYDSGLRNYLVKEYSNAPIILFGSYSKGEDLENSDIDLYVESLRKDSINLQKFEKKLGRKVQIFRYKNIKEIKNENLANNIVCQRISFISQIIKDSKKVSSFHDISYEKTNTEMIVNPVSLIYQMCVHELKNGCIMTFKNIVSIVLIEFH